MGKDSDRGRDSEEPMPGSPHPRELSHEKKLAFPDSKGKNVTCCLEVPARAPLLQTRRLMFDLVGKTLQFFTSVE